MTSHTIGRMGYSFHLVQQLNEAWEQRRITDGIQLLGHAGIPWNNLRSVNADAASLVLCVAQWIDVGYRGHTQVESLLTQFPSAVRSRMPLSDYLLVRMAEAFAAMADGDADTAIKLLDFVLQAQRELADERLIVLAHFWKGRSHRKKGEYEDARRHIVEARDRADIMKLTKLAAVIRIQEAWLLFQSGSPKEALGLFDLAESQLKETDDQISLGNIVSARGRIVRRAGEYDEALEYYDRAIALYGMRDLNHSNLARTLVNAAYVKRLIALQLRKRIDARIEPDNRDRKTRRGVRSAGDVARYSRICREALGQLARAGEIYALHQHHGGTGSVLVNTGHLHLDLGDVGKATAEGQKAYELACGKHDHILMARARILEASAENVRVEEELGEDADTAVYAGIARRYAEEAISLAKQTQNRRLLAGAYIARGMVAANDFFQEWDEARRCEAQAAALLRFDDGDHLGEELLTLKSRILLFSGIDETLRAWSEGIVAGKTFQQVSEAFAEIVIPKVWTREGRNISRVAERLSISPKKVRRILRNTGLLNHDERTSIIRLNK